MPMYQFWCDKCFEPFEITMTLDKLEEYDKNEKTIIKCPLCGAALRKLICPPKIIRCPAWH